MLSPWPWPLTGAEEWMNNPVLRTDDGLAGGPPGGLLLGGGGRRGQALGFRVWKLSEYSLRGAFKAPTGQEPGRTAFWLRFFPLNGTQLMEDLTPSGPQGKKGHSCAHRLSVQLCSHGLGRREPCSKLSPECPRPGCRGGAPSTGRLSAESPRSTQSKRSC